MAELKSWGEGTKRAANGLMIVWVVCTGLGILTVLLMLGTVLSL